MTLRDKDKMVLSRHDTTPPTTELQNRPIGIITLDLYQNMTNVFLLSSLKHVNLAKSYNLTQRIVNRPTKY